ncbi:MAG: M14 family zinc carboxypeptidase [Wenzhouxiangella sp.]
MHKTLLTLTFFLLSIGFVSGAVAGPGLPADFDPDPAIPTPAEVLGFEPGEWHPRHDQIVTYLEQLADRSDRVSMEILGQTHGERPLPLLVFASPERLANLDQITADRRRQALAGEGPAVIWLGYSVHGNEPSGASAAVVMAWYLAASNDPEVLAWLDELIIVMEPVLNPDGLDRFAHWVNMHRGRHPNAAPADREHNEAWPNGRTNYYWFDLNRDWLPLVHPESRLRAAQLQRWMPHVLTDHHEMGPNTTYFFQPGVPERNNPLTPERNYELTAEIAQFHARILDQAGEAYFTRELFDDYYLGKGSTYPDLTGGIGILFEQASSRGHVQDTVYGPRHFVDTVANQVRTSLSTLQAGYALADELVAYQAEFFRTARDEARASRQAGWVLGDGNDPVRAYQLVDLLLAHGIEVRPASESVTIDGQEYAPGAAWVIRADQKHYRFLRSVFEQVTDPGMDVFYDVSSWPLALSYGLPLAEVRRLPSSGDPLAEAPRHRVTAPAAEPIAWLVRWDQYGAAPLLAALLADGYRIQAVTEPVATRINGETRRLVAGSLVMHPGMQPEELSPLADRLGELAERHRVEVLAADSGLVLEGPDLGAPSVPVLRAPKVALLTGEGVRSTHAGYIWHWFDTRLEQPLTRLDWQQIWRVDLSTYTHLIIADGQYELLPNWVVDRITQFVRQGGTLIAVRNASTWVERLDLDWAFVEEDVNGNGSNGEVPERRPYGDFQGDFARQLIGGSALNVVLDTSHPLAFGYSQGEAVTFRRGAHRLSSLNNAYSRAAVYSDDPLAAGFLSAENRERLAGATALDLSHHGQGRVVRMADDFLFRGYWLGTERLFANALFFSPLVRPTQLPPWVQ